MALVQTTIRMVATMQTGFAGSCARVCILSPFLLINVYCISSDFSFLPDMTDEYIELSLMYIR